VSAKLFSSPGVGPWDERGETSTGRNHYDEAAFLPEKMKALFTRGGRPQTTACVYGYIVAKTCYASQTVHALTHIREFKRCGPDHQRM